MSATSVFPMCVRASRGLLRLRSGVAGASCPAVVDIVRTLSTDKPPAGAGGATGGLAQAILQERLQQQQQSQGQPPPDGKEGEREGEQTEDKKQKENTAYAKKMVLRLAGLMGLGGAVGMVYIFGTNSVDEQGNTIPDEFDRVNVGSLCERPCSVRTVRSGLFVFSSEPAWVAPTWAKQLSAFPGPAGNQTKFILADVIAPGVYRVGWCDVLGG
ncbi:mitochondrial import inner membrane translocase subunit TIM50 [Lates japonicus]|uniref:Mitochondrial import inner membrane translocase subunit TIM50 n=1 Tax=Lates japonicus TaxID=270547 RepID=A0AAD3RF71_LATJO|nr:mitochondrial import inner membrane translocase subunit TIM50 [Lates japonicus]